jgi:hypothetical protein
MLMVMVDVGVVDDNGDVNVRGVRGDDVNSTARGVRGGCGKDIGATGGGGTGARGGRGTA